MQFFVDVCSIFFFFSIFDLMKMCIFPEGTPLFSKFSQESCSCNFHAFWTQKTCQKPTPDEARTVKKSMPKTCRFSTSIFSSFGLDFVASWASKLEPSWFLSPQKTLGSAHFYDLKLTGSIKYRLGGLLGRFSSVLASILEPSGLPSPPRCMQRQAC